ncbi:hypothetical protein BRARA_E01423 [Brassica rapa]|uniref:glycerol kinase n=1 Tax=Brassica campestris TaxID=3711 RepID=A0A397ZA33_BRACM|nr:hypothetical protein BRARA_E01423 [Brassica rapa]
MPHPLDKATADGHNVDRGLKAIGFTDQRETPSFEANPLDFLSTKLSYGWMLAPVPAAGTSFLMNFFLDDTHRRLEKELSGGRSHFVESCALPISTYFSAMKLLWLMENVHAVKDAIKKGYAIFGTIDTWLIWNMTGGVNGGLHIVNNSEVIGKICKDWPIPGIKIAGCLGDQHTAMLGQACKKGEAKSTYDTGPFILLNTGELGPQAQTNYDLEGSIAIAGAAVQWLRDSLGIIKSASEIEDLAAMVETTGGVYFVPAFNGLFAWREDARGVCIGITRFTYKSHIARAVLESMCFQVKDVLDSLNNEKAEFLLRVDGGATANNLLMQIQADLMGTPVVRPVVIETTALGAAYALYFFLKMLEKTDVPTKEDNIVYKEILKNLCEA